MADPVASTGHLEDLASRLGHRFADPSLLELAITHRSWCAEQPSNGSNERLEFLGDSVVGLVVTEELYGRFADLPEGEMAKARSSVVSTPALAEVAAELCVGSYVRLGRGEHLTGGREKPSILADTLEAIIGAVHLDGGIDASRTFVVGLLGNRIDIAASGPGVHDHKTQLQELAARVWEELPSYELTESGPDHDKRFDATVHIDGEVRGRGVGRSKKQAEQAAAHAALIELEHQRPDESGDACVPSSAAVGHIESERGDHA